MTSETAPPPHEAILVVDDESAILKSMERTLRDAGFTDILLCNDSRRALDLVRTREPGVVLLDLVMPYLSGEDLLAALRQHAPRTPVIIVTANDEVATAVRCIQAGAYDYLTKPLDFDRLIATVTRGMEVRRLQRENDELRRQTLSPKLIHPDYFAAIVTQAPGMRAVFAYVEAIARSIEPVLIVGETGVGKELVADALHRSSGCGGELVSVNVAGLDETSFADTLFGHTRGAFTGANQPREGLVERAADGMLFLDEIGDLKLDMQTKLLRLVQEREYFPLGSDKPRTTRCRVIAATNRDLRARMRAGHFREDLFFRLGAHLVRVPPLRERTEDIPLLVGVFLDEAARSLGKAKPTPPRELYTYLSGYTFPGNVRELRAMVHDAVARHEKGVLSLRTFLDHMARADEDSAARPATAGTAGAIGLTFGADLPTLKGATSLLLSEALKRANGNQSAAARLLGISRRTMNRYAITGLTGFPSEGNEEPDEPETP
jgi:DNA-binding NtrC family response regulator